MVRLRSPVHSLFATALAVCALTGVSGRVAAQAQEQTQTDREQTLQTVIVTGSDHQAHATLRHPVRYRS